MQEAVSFKANGLSLQGLLHLPDAPNPPLIIGCHGMLSTGESPKQKALADACNRLGIAYFRFDHRGCGQSEGDFARVTTFEGRRADLLAAIEYLKGRMGTDDPLGLFGSSLGGAIVLSVAGDMNIQTVVTLAAPVRFSAIQVPDTYATDPAFRGMTKEQMAFDIAGDISNVNNILICHGDADQVVPYENATEIHETVSAPKELLRIQGGDHPLSLPAHQAQFMSHTIHWFKQLLPGD